MAREQWCALTEKEKEDHFIKFCKYRPTKPMKSTIEAHNGPMEINASAVNIKTKPKDNHRIRNQKTQPKAGAPRNNAMAGTSSKGSTASKLDAMVISELKQKYLNLQAGISSTNDDITPNDDAAASGADITANNGLVSNAAQDVTNNKSKKVAKGYVWKHCLNDGKEKSYTQSHNLKSHIQKVHGSTV